MERRPKKPSTYDMLKRLDKKVQQNKTQRKDDSYSRNSNEYRRRRSPKSYESRKRRSESPRWHDQNKKPFKGIPEIVIDDTDYDIPDRSFGDLYCKACDSHMNSEQMWEAHIQGKRHQKHIKKGEQGELKYEILDEDPLILPDIKKSTEPIIGLQHCCEIRRLEGKPIYQCFLCSANVPNGLSLIEHVVGLKHRMAYLKEHDPVKHDLIDKTNLKKGMIEPVVAECIRLHQDKYGTGIIQVKLDKSKPSVTSNYKKITQDVSDYNMKRDDRQNNYPDERDDDFRYLSREQQDYQREGLSREQQDYQRPHYSDEPPYEGRYSSSHPSVSMRDVTPYTRGETPSVDRRSPMAYDRGYYAPLNQPSYRQFPPQATPQNEDLRHEQRRSVVQERNQSSSNLFQSLLKIMEAMPSMLFLELVLHRVENMDPSETELSLMQKIGNHMISIVMNRKLQKLSPDLLGKCHSKPKPEEEQNNKSTNNLNSLMNLVSQFNNTKDSSGWGNQDGQLEKPSANVPAFMTQTPGSFYNSWGGSSNAVTEIPGLTLSAATEASTSWSDSSFRNTYDGF